MDVTAVLFVFILQEIVTTSSYPAKGVRGVDDRFMKKREPYQVSLNYPGLGHYCGGAIITRNAALTVTYCLINKPITSIYFRCGIFDLHESSSLGCFGTDAYYHEAYDGITNIVALALVEKFPIDGVRVAAIQIAPTPIKVGSIITITGWTTYDDDSEATSHELESFDVDIVGHGRCAASFGEYQTTIVAPGTLCAGPGSEGKGYCFGDTGSPVVNADGLLVGGVSLHEKKCLQSDLPAVFCDFTYYKGWIDRMLRKSVRNSSRNNTSRVLVLISLPFTFTLVTWLSS